MADRAARARSDTATAGDEPWEWREGSACLGLETQDALLLLDDRDARRYARALELEITGTLGLLLRAKERGILDAVRPVLDRLQALGFRLNARTRQMVLKRASETT